MRAGNVHLQLVDNLNQNANCALTEIWKKCNDEEKTNFEVGPLIQKKE